MTDVRAQAGLAAAFGIAASATVASRHYVAGQHLWSARYHARLCVELEQQLAGTTVFDIRHRTHAVNAVLSSVVFLEALVNETFQDAADATDEHTSARVAPLGKRCIAIMAEFWNASESGSRYVGVLDKFQMALLFAEKSLLDRGANPHQDAKLLVSIRNYLVHFKPATRTHGEETKDEQKMKERFAPNTLMAGQGNPWFPDKCLGAGCAGWAWKTSQSIADEWTSRLDIPRYYGDDDDQRNGWPSP